MDQANPALSQEVLNRMRRSLFATLGVVSVVLVAATCDPNNAPPNAPNFRIAEYDSTTITAVFDNQCRDDGKPDGKCQQWLIITGGDQQARSYKATNGVVLIENRKPATPYNLFPYHTDTEQQTNGDTIYDFKTAGVTGPKILSITPPEIVVPGEVIINGIALNSGLVPKLIDPITNAQQTLTVNSFAPNRVTASVPKPSGLTTRKPYFLVLGNNNKADRYSDRVYLNPNETTRPVGQDIQLSFIRWLPSGYCNNGLCGGDCKLIDGWDPTIRAIFASLLFGNNPGPTADVDDWWPDTWDDNFWMKWKSQVEDTSDEWSSICSPAWNAGSAYVRGAAEAGWGRITLPSGRLYWISLDYDSHDVEHLNKRLAFNSKAEHRDFCKEDPHTSELLPRTIPDDCVKWQVGAGTNRINVHLVGGFIVGGEKVDPSEMRGITNPPNIYGDTTNLVILSDNPSESARVEFKNAPIAAGERGCYPQHVGTPSIWHWYLSGTDPIGATYWWGPDAGRDAEPTPNLLSHELVHALSVYVHDPGGDIPDVCFTPAVGVSRSECPRGFDLAAAWEDSTSNASRCSGVLAREPVQ